jgi:hypothetical protein
MTKTLKILKIKELRHARFFHSSRLMGYIVPVRPAIRPPHNPYYRPAQVDPEGRWWVTREVPHARDYTEDMITPEVIARWEAWERSLKIWDERRRVAALELRAQYYGHLLWLIEREVRKFIGYLIATAGSSLPDILLLILLILSLWATDFFSTELWTWLKDLLGANRLEWLADLIENSGRRLFDFIDQIFDWLKNFLENLLPGITTDIKEVVEEIKGWVKILGEEVKGLVEKIIEGVKGVVEGVIKGVKGFLEGVIKGIKDLIPEQAPDETPEQKPKNGPKDTKGKPENIPKGKPEDIPDNIPVGAAACQDVVL